jgi:hypothetical protein
MNLCELTAQFPTAPDAERAMAQLRALGIRGARLHPSGDTFRIEAQVPDELSQAAEEAARSSGASDVLVLREEHFRSQNWMSHHQGQVTGDGVTAAQGDSEAGDPS